MELLYVVIMLPVFAILLVDKALLEAVILIALAVDEEDTVGAVMVTLVVEVPT